MKPEVFQKLASLLHEAFKDPWNHKTEIYLIFRDGFGIGITDATKIISNIPSIASGFSEYLQEYDKIIKDAQKASLEWDRKNLDLKNPNNLHNRIKSAGSYAERILLRTELLYAAVQLADADIEQKVSETEKMITTAEKM